MSRKNARLCPVPASPDAGAEMRHRCRRKSRAHANRPDLQPSRRRARTRLPTISCSYRDRIPRSARSEARTKPDRWGCGRLAVSYSRFSVSLAGRVRSHARPIARPAGRCRAAAGGAPWSKSKGVRDNVNNPLGCAEDCLQLLCPMFRTGACGLLHSRCVAGAPSCDGLELDADIGDFGRATVISLSWTHSKGVCIDESAG